MAKELNAWITKVFLSKIWGRPQGGGPGQCDMLGARDV